MRYAQIRKMDISNGEGIGVALFVQGCPFHCYNCFNQETWDFSGGYEWTDENTNIFLEISDKPHIKRISILGGEPLAKENITGIWRLLRQVRSRFGDSKKVWLYTGYTWEELLNHPLPNPYDDMVTQLLSHHLCDIVVDGRYVDELKDYTLRWRGSSNQRVINVPESINKKKVVLYEW